MEADVLRWSLLVIGSVVIAGLAIHGIWVSRKNNEKKASITKNQKASQQFETASKHSFDQYSDDLSDDRHIDEQLFSVKSEPVVDEQEINFVTDEPLIEDEPSKVVDESNISSEFDDLGLGAVRVVSSTEKDASKSSSTEQAEIEINKPDLTETKQPAKPSESKIYASVVTQPKPEYAAKYQSLAAETVAISQQEKVNLAKNHVMSKSSAAELGASGNSGYPANNQYQAPEPPPFLLKKHPTEDSVSQPLDTANQSMAETMTQNPQTTDVATEESTTQNSIEPLAEKISLGEQARNLVKRKKSETVKKRQEPKMTEDQLHIDFDDAPIPEPEVAKEKRDSKIEPKTNPQPQQEVLVLNVKVAEGESIAGAALLPMLLTLGFKFGEQDIFHRHVNSNGKGPVLFSLANMFKPGNFDIDSLENFTTQGISLFMILPIEGEPHQVFNMMHNAARKIADEFSGQIYDGRRALLTKQSLQQYVEKIREFERQRMLTR